MYSYKNPSLPVEERVKDLINRMTLNEKIAQLITTKGFNLHEKVSDNEIKISDELVKLYEEFPGAGLFSWNRADWYSGRNWETGLTPELIPVCFNLFQDYAVNHTRLGIPLSLTAGSIHGIFACGGMVLPTGIGMASAWNRDLIKKAFQNVADEAMTVAKNGCACDGPTQDLARDARWSRIEETFGEDPYLSAELSKSFCKGILARRNRGEEGPVPSVRHFLAHGETEGGLNQAPSHCGVNELYNIHLRPFEAALKAGANVLMTASNLVDGYPCILSPLINETIRGKWGWDGVIFSDAGTIGVLVDHGFAKDLGEAATLAVKAGTDMCCWEAEAFKNGLIMAFEHDLLTEDDLNPALERILGSKFRNGLFEKPYIEDVTAASRILGCQAHRETARQVARESITLLQNKNDVLPLKGVKKIAVVGPNADNMHNQIGDYSSPQRPGDTITVRGGFDKLAEKDGFSVAYARGCGIRSLKKDGFPEAVEAAKDADAVVVVIGGSSIPNIALAQADNGMALALECLKDTEQDKDSGEGYDRAHLNFCGAQMDLLREMKKTGKKIITVLIMGRPLILTEVCELSDAVVLAWYPGMEGGTAIAETILGYNNPSGKLPITFPDAVGQIPVYYNTMLKRVNYVDQLGQPTFRFGFGLSYTTFELSGVKVEKSEQKADEVNTVYATVTNTGKCAGAQVCQFYLQDCIFSVARPYCGELRGFEKVYLEPGESKQVAFKLGAEELGLYNRNLEFVVEPGTFIARGGFDLDNLTDVEFNVVG